MNKEYLQIAIKAVQIFSETHPRPSQVTMAQVAEMLGISRQTVSKMVKAGSISLNKCGLIPINEVDKVIKPVM